MRNRFFYILIYLVLSQWLFGFNQVDCIAPNTNVSTFVNEFEPGLKYKYTQYLSENDENLPISDILKILNIGKATFIGTRKAIDLKIDTIQIPKNKIKGVPKGLDILNHELAPVHKFDLLYNNKNQIIAILPSLINEELIKFKANGRAINYMKLFPYNFIPPALDTDNLLWAKQKWIDFSKQFYEDKECLEHYLEETGLNNFLTDLNYRQHKPFVILELNKFNHELIMPTSMECNPKDILKIFDFVYNLKNDNPRVLFPILPTVYSPANGEHKLADFNYHLQLYLQGKDIKMADNDKSLIVGPGSGIDTWILWQATKREVYAVGINPFEVANVKILAKLAQMKVNIKLHNNIISPKNKSAFKGEKFKLICSNAPFYKELKFSHKFWANQLKKLLYKLFLHFQLIENRSLYQYSDNDRGDFIKGFAKGLVRHLDSDGGKSLLWNRTYDIDFINKVLIDSGVIINNIDMSDEDELDVVYFLSVSKIPTSKFTLKRFISLFSWWHKGKALEQSS